ncbi:DUF488 family protein [Aciduricibacillus chroicocephali]|uniref:DUF488 family protein n=1 Tax=Aciduricibacillus chroicocephali TaxID=3054939 RepID=A0ABY9KUT5_9BACI|nr:DUF488 family protein [Bacillaceae bacterium 44XB]
MPVSVKRIYEEKSAEDGVRILVDRVWPRGVSKEAAALDIWAKDVAPSVELRKWFNHEADQFPEFKRRYKEELKQGDQRKELEELKEVVKQHNKEVTLLYAAKNEKHNQAQVLKEILDRQHTED